MTEPICICCYEPVTAENGGPLYLQASTDVLDAQPIAWVHKDCLADYATPFEVADFSQSELDALREYACGSNR
jgi:hypothetical protein